nr:hypothetical protein [Tanacetum cinerariifolium]
AQTLIEIKAAKPKAITTAATTVTATGTRPKEKGIVMQEPSERSTPTLIDSSQKSSQAKDKGKGKMVEPEKPLKRKGQIMIDKEFAKNLEAQMQAELEEEDRLARLKEEETNIALIESWDNTQAMMDADYELVARLQEEETRELSIEENSRLFVELMDKRKKHFARLRAEEIRIKPSTKAQNRNQMCTYLKNMANYKHNQLKSKSFKEIQMLFNNTIKEDLEVLWSIVKTRHKKTKPVDDMDNLLFQTLNTMFEHHVEDNIWKYQQRLMKDMYLNEVFRYILLMKINILIKKLENSEGEHQVYERIVRIKRLHGDVKVTTAQ